jgi:hypothetical protein
VGKGTHAVRRGLAREEEGWGTKREGKRKRENEKEKEEKKKENRKKENQGRELEKGFRKLGEFLEN